MFKFIRRKIVEGIIKDILDKLPEYKEYALFVFNEHKEELFEKVKNAIEKVVKDFIAKKLNNNEKAK